MARVLLKNLTKKYEDIIAVNNINISIEDKEFVVLVGPSGCGKTTTLRMIAGLETVTHGEIYIGDRLVNHVPPKDRDIAMVFQNYAIYPHMSVYDNMAFSLKLNRTPKKEIRERVAEAARILAIEHLLNRKPKQLSGGERQRVALGRAIVRNPQIFLMDEPLSNLDAKLRFQMRTEIAKLHQKFRTTIIYVTHDQTEAMTMADRIVVMKDGVVYQVGKPQDVYEHPNNVFVAGFIGSPAMNFIHVAVTDDFKLKCAYFEIDTTDRLRKLINKNKLAGKEVILGIRPEDLEDSAFISPSPEGNAITSRVEVTEPMGVEVFVYVKLDGINMTARVNPRTKARPGNNIKLCVDLNKLHLFDESTEEAYV